MAMENFLAEFLMKNNKQIISKDELTSLRKRGAEREDELKNTQEAFEKLKADYQKQANQVKFLSRMVAGGQTKLTDNYVSKLKYEELERTVSDLKGRLQAAKETISCEKIMRLKMEQEVKELQKKLKCVKDREFSLSKTNQNLMCINKCFESQLKEAREATMEQVKLNVKISNKKKELTQQFTTEIIATRREIMALKNEIERLTMDQFKFLAFVREIVNASGYQDYQSGDAFTARGQLDSITSHVKSQFEKWRQDSIEHEQRNNRPTNWRALDQEKNLGADSDTSMSTTSSRSSSTSRSRQSIGLRLPEPSHRPSQHSSFEARSSVTDPTIINNNRKRNWNNGLKQLQREIMKRKNHSMYRTKKRRKPDQIWCVCGTYFKSMGALRDHIKKFSFDWKFKCEKCPRMFSYLTELKTHMHKDHGVSNPFQGFMGCTFCGEMFPNRGELQKHLTSVCKLRPENKSLHFHQPNFKRATLKTTFDRAESDSGSSISIGTGTVEISDSESDQDENENSNLPSTSFGTLHEAVSSCSERRDALGRIHRAVVTESETSTSSSARKNDKNKKSIHPCRCTCGSQYSNIPLLQQHIKTMTFGYPLECIKCLQKFPSFCFLKKHMEKKHGIFNYNDRVGCSLCGRQLESISYYKKHFKKEHGGKNHEKH